MVKIPEFQEFIAKPGARLGSYYFSITAIGTIAIHSGFYYQENVKEYKSVTILFDPKQKLLGLRFSREDTGEGRLKLHHAKSGKNASLGAMSFFKEYKLLTKELQGRYIPERVESTVGQDTFMIDLNERIPPKT